LFFESSSRSIFLFEHDLFGKPVPTFPDHAPEASRQPFPSCGLTEVGWRGTEVATERPIEIGDIAEAVFMSDLSNVQVATMPINQHAPDPDHAVSEDERGKRRARFLEQFP